MTLSESLIRVPGITAQNRSQMAQDPQISTRGFGSRSSFGVRGIRLYVDGIPLSMPDGIGNPGSVDLGTIKSIEVMRGPFSALYGNSSGGVIQLFTEDAPKTPEVSAGVLFGSYVTRRENARAAGTVDGVEYLINYSDFSSDGYRDHSASTKKQATAKFKINLSDDTKLTTIVNWFDQDAQDPGGLKRNGSVGDPSAFSNPRSVNITSLLADTRVKRSNTQIGFNLEHKINDNNSLNFVTYIGNRDNLQYLALNNGGVGRASKISREFYGTDIRWNNTGEILNRPYTLTAGVSYGKLNDDRQDISALNGVQLPSNITNLNRDETNLASNADQYIQAKWAVLEQFDFHLGARRTKVKLEVEDNLVDLSRNFNVPANAKFRDGSGSVTFQKTTPVAGIVWKVNPMLNFYANAGKGFETPTLVEIAYDNAATGTGPNLNIKPSTSTNFEIGAKAYLSDNTRTNLTLFKTLTDDEIVISANTAGRSSYTNAGKTKRDGLEFSIDSLLPHNISVYGAYTLLNAKFDSSFVSFSNPNSPGIVSTGNIIPATYRTQAYGEVAWKHDHIGFKTALEARYNSKSYVDDINSDAAPSYTIFNVRAGFEQKLQQWRLSEFARIENIFNKDYIGSVRVNDGNMRFFEPAAGRNYLVGLSASYLF